MAKYDIETLLEDIKAVLIANLNTKIAAINTEKNDTITLATVAAAAFFDDMDNKSANWNPIVLVDVGEISGQSEGNVLSKDVSVNIALILYDNGMDLLIKRRMLRYQRCLEEVIQANFFYNKSHGRWSLESLPVMSFTRSDNSQRYKICGINLNTSFV